LERPCANAHPRATSWSIAPKIDAPAASFISIRIVSPKRMKGVFGAPPSIVSIARF